MEIQVDDGDGGVPAGCDTMYEDKVAHINGPATVLTKSRRIYKTRRCNDAAKQLWHSLSNRVIRRKVYRGEYSESSVGDR